MSSKEGDVDSKADGFPASVERALKEVLPRCEPGPWPLEHTSGPSEQDKSMISIEAASAVQPAWVSILKTSVRTYESTGENSIHGPAEDLMEPS